MAAIFRDRAVVPMVLMWWLVAIIMIALVSHARDILQFCRGSPSDLPPIPVSSRCDPCLPAWGMVSPCTDGNTKTKCVPCDIGYWTPPFPHMQQCTPCSKCGPGLYVQLKCNATHDTICDACDTLNPVITTDYATKCLDISLDNQENKLYLDDMLLRHDDVLKQQQYESEEEPFLSWTVSEVETDSPTHKKPFFGASGDTFLVVMCVAWLACCCAWSCCCKQQQQQRQQQQRQSRHLVVLTGRGRDIYRNLTEQDHIDIRTCANRLKLAGKLPNDDQTSTEGELWWDEGTTPTNMTMHDNPLSVDCDTKSTDRLVV